MMRVESGRNHHASASAEPHFNRSAVRCGRWPTRLSDWRHFHGHKLRRFRFPQPPLPREELTAPQTPLDAKSRYALPALALLRNQTPPPRPRFQLALPHP